MSNNTNSERQPLSQILLHIALGLLVVLLLAGGIWHTMTTTSDSEKEEAEAAARRAKRRRPVVSEPEVRTVEASGEWTTPVVAVGNVETAEAMDSTGLRFQVNRLRMSALEGDPAGRESAAAGIKLYGGKAARFLDEEIARESDPVVRMAFEDARKGLK